MPLLVIPPEIKSNINKWSGYINQSSIYSGKNLKGLFRTEENKLYLIRELYSLLTNFKYVFDNLPESIFNNVKYTRKILNVTISKKYFIDNMMNRLLEIYKLPYNEEIPMQNPVLQLSSVNLNFLVETSKNIIGNISNLDPLSNRVNENNTIELGEYDYDPSSYSDGVWRPEDLFINCKRNRDNPYWKPLEVNIYSDPLLPENYNMVGHKYNNPIYGKTKSQIPQWQSTVNNREYDYDNSLGLRDGGNDDRRTQRPSGYNTANTRRK